MRDVKGEVRRKWDRVSGLDYVSWVHIRDVASMVRRYEDLMGKSMYAAFVCGIFIGAAIGTLW